MITDKWMNHYDHMLERRRFPMELEDPPENRLPVPKEPVAGKPARPMAAYKPVHIPRAFEGVANQIREQLASGALRPGDRLPSERDLAERFSLSRNTVREALRSLEVAGILVLRKGATGGAFIREGQGDAVIAGFADLFRLGLIKPEHLTEARLIMSVAATRIACQRATEADFDMLRENVRASEEAVAKGDVAERVRINLEFHRILAKASGNPVLFILTDALLEIQSQLIQVLTPAPEKLVMASRRRLLRHLQVRNEEKAAQEMENHLKMLQRYYLQEKRNDGA
jgi:GntR family transcriptional repressor for pyruvate dehydrogenase complex